MYVLHTNCLMYFLFIFFKFRSIKVLIQVTALLTSSKRAQTSAKAAHCIPHPTPNPDGDLAQPNSIINHGLSQRKLA